MARQRLTEDFVGHLKILRDRTGNSPHNLRRALERHADLAVSIRELNAFWSAIERHRKESSRRFIVQAHPEFARALADYEARWQNSWITLMDWEDEKAGRETFTDLIERMLSEPGEPNPSPPENWDFDPDEDDAGVLVEQLFEYARDRADDEPFFSRAGAAAAWLEGTVGVHLQDMAGRFKEFPVIIVPAQVSDHHGVTAERSLYSYLTDLRLSYVTGADLSALAMCRACTEIMIRRHYAHDEDTKLTPLVKRTQEKFGFLRKHNLVRKIDEANDLMHSNQDNIQSRERTRQLVREWVKSLTEIIAQAPRA